MTVKLVVLKSGENIISDVKEGFYEDKLVCYLLEKPCLVTINGTYRIVGEDEDDKVSISLKPWPLFSKQTTIELINDWVVTIVDPTDQLKIMYETQVLGDDQNETNQNSLSIEQSDSNHSD